MKNSFDIRTCNFKDILVSFAKIKYLLANKHRAFESLELVEHTVERNKNVYIYIGEAKKNEREGESGEEGGIGKERKFKIVKTPT